MSLSPDENGATKSEDAGSTAQPQHENSTEEPEGNPTAMHGFKLWAIFIGICFGAFLMSLDIFVIATVLLSPPPCPRKPDHLTPCIGHSIHHVRLQGYVAAGLVSGRLFTHDMRIDSAGRKAKRNLSPTLDLHYILFHLYDRKPYLRLCSE